MAWHQHVVVPYKPPSQGTGVKVTLRAIKATGNANMVISISEAVAGRLGWGEGDKLELMVGEGEHHGLLRFRKNNDIGSVEIVRRKISPGGIDNHKSFFSLRLGYMPQFIQRSESGRWANYDQVEDDWVEIVLPSWADETDPRKVKKPQAIAPTPAAVAGGGSPAIPPSVVQAANFKRPVRNVTGSIMGDPPPNRNRG